jgi:hypothetical protein
MPSRRNLFVRLDVVYMHVCIYVYMPACMHVSRYVSMHVIMHVRFHVRMDVHNKVSNYASLNVIYVGMLCMHICITKIYLSTYLPMLFSSLSIFIFICSYMLHRSMTKTLFRNKKCLIVRRRMLERRKGQQI